jgi:hypothetical protein
MIFSQFVALPKAEKQIGIPRRDAYFLRRL